LTKRKAEGSKTHTNPNNQKEKKMATATLSSPDGQTGDQSPRKEEFVEETPFDSMSELRENPEPLEED
jgi:hypothetical protein